MANTALPSGVMSVMVGVGNTVKLAVVVSVTPFTVTEIGPVIASAGTSALILVVVDAVMLAVIPLNDTVFSASGVLKFVPVIVTIAPTAAPVGLKLLIVGLGKTIKLVAEGRVTPLVVNVILPVVAPGGTLVVRDVVVAESVIAVVLLNLIMLSAVVGPKFEPLIVTTAPIAPLPGVKPEIPGEGNTVKFEVLNIVIPLTVTLTGPVLAPAGTEVISNVADDEVTVEGKPLNDTELFAGVVLKFVPEIITIAPGAPVAGLNPINVGVGNTVKLPGL